MKQKAYRHGENLLLKVDSLPENLTKSGSNIFMTGSHGNNHSLDNGELYLTGESPEYGYLVASNTRLFHPEHGSKDGELIEDGIYKLIKQQEYTPDGLVPVID
jgi:hypothetical protein